MARTVADAAILLSALTGVDARDEATAASTGRSRTEYTSVLDPAGLKGARLGVCRSRFMGYSPATDALMEGAIDALKRMGAVIVDPADITTAGQFDDSEFAVLLYEFKADLNKYLGEWAPTAGAKTLEDLIAFNERTKEKEMPYLGQVRGLPVGLSFVGRPWTEAALIKYALAYEQATKARRPPRFAPSADLSGG